MIKYAGVLDWLAGGLSETSAAERASFGTTQYTPSQVRRMVNATPDKGAQTWRQVRSAMRYSPATGRYDYSVKPWESAPKGRPMTSLTDAQQAKAQQARTNAMNTGAPDLRKPRAGTDMTSELTIPNGFRFSGYEGDTPWKNVRAFNGMLADMVAPAAGWKGARSFQWYPRQAMDSLKSPEHLAFVANLRGKGGIGARTTEISPVVFGKPDYSEEGPHKGSWGSYLGGSRLGDDMTDASGKPDPAKLTEHLHSTLFGGSRLSPLMDWSGMRWNRRAGDRQRVDGANSVPVLRADAEDMHRPGAAEAIRGLSGSGEYLAPYMSQNLYRSLTGGASGVPYDPETGAWNPMYAQYTRDLTRQLGEKMGIPQADPKSRRIAPHGSSDSFFTRPYNTYEFLYAPTQAGAAPLPEYWNALKARRQAYKDLLPRYAGVQLAAD